MAENKLSWTELRRALAARANINEKIANNFLNAFNAQLVDALKQEKQVKINGLGVFKLQAVAPRKSVNVTTGEEIVIDGYNKVAFVPEAGVKELVEKAGAVGATAQALDLTNDPIQKLGAQADEIVGILGELGQSPAEEPKAAEPEPKAVEPEPAIEPAPEPVPEPTPAPKPKKAAPKYHFMRDTLICVVILLLLLLVGYFFLREQIGTWIEQWMQPKPQTEQVVSTDAAQEVEATEPTETVATPQPITVEYTGFIATERINEGSRLAWLSKRYYGAKVYWPYIYDANKDHLNDPNMIIVGTPIRIPKLTKLQLDTTNTATIAVLEQLLSNAEAAMK